MKLHTIKQFSKEHQAFTESDLRYLIFNESENGLKQSGAIVRIGRKVLIDGDKFFHWVEFQNGGSVTIAEKSVRKTNALFIRTEMCGRPDELSITIEIYSRRFRNRIAESMASRSIYMLFLYMLLTLYHHLSV